MSQLSTAVLRFCWLWTSLAGTSGCSCCARRVKPKSTLSRWLIVYMSSIEIGSGK
ncbi:hypothetical protein PF005_g30482 [Phytophthora fragariae]|uniref:RxLR effector protein n=1 Tax=Phytophthora fragariae TaxID=53985 RepID=A0A6A4BED4_9STRA|nr:hypothetical protein PF003_g5887 [Phytophthora fragariae]KAE8918381.1 hypothetical protein PF009_g31303 [Phytophthora fragariae]KAE8960898.1 hypothetical protein PF011_g29941 [Phytophthora fragariae]KAE9163364.1 hypothetical protein PF005_g30482 [Phytophthora fragariae]KAE9167880.1 hypothetical protein PF002_g30762 [Phytophthora fragariae]